MKIHDMELLEQLWSIVGASFVKVSKSKQKFDKNGKLLQLESMNGIKDIEFDWKTEILNCLFESSQNKAKLVRLEAQV